MQDKAQLRKKYLIIRKKKYFETNENFFKPILSIFKKKFTNKKVFLSIYYPSNYEVNILNFLNILDLKKIITLLPSVKLKNMKFFRWKKYDNLIVNKFGMLEPLINNSHVVPNIILLPLLAYDKKKYRLGYGKGYYDSYLNKYLSRNKDITTIGIAFSFQKHNKLPISKHDVKLDYILTEKGLK